MTLDNWIAIVLFALGLSVSVYVFIYRLDKRVTKVESRCENYDPIMASIATLNTRLDKLANDNEVFWRVIGPHLENIIHSPKSVERDELVSKLTNGTIEPEELPVLIDMLRKALAGSEWNPEKKFAGAWLLARATQLMNDTPYDRRMARRPV